LHEGKDLRRAILDGAAQIATPTFASTLSICIVFVSVVFLTGPAKFLFTPLALAVVFAMLASYLLSRTLVPVMTLLMLRREAQVYRGEGHQSGRGRFWAIHRAFDLRFERFSEAYCRMLRSALGNRRSTAWGFAAFFAASFCLLGFIGRDFFPYVDAGQLRLHVRAPAGTRVEETAHVFNRVEQSIRRLIPPRDLDMTVDNIGLPVGGVNLAFSDSATIGEADGEMLVSLKKGHAPTQAYVALLRRELHREFPQETFFFQPADIVSQILNFGLPAPIDIQVVGTSPDNYRIAQQIAQEVKGVPGAADVHVHQVLNDPSIFVDVDRDRASQLGLTQRDVANSLLISLSSSGQAAPNFWLDPKNGVSYLVAVQTPQEAMNSMSALGGTPLSSNGGTQEILDNVATVSRMKSAQVVNHYDVQPVFDVYANVQGRDLGGVTTDVQRILRKHQATLPRGTTTKIRGQADSMNSSFAGLEFGIAFAVILVYLLMVVNFQTWIDPLIIISALPGAVSGILWMLFLTGTTFSVPALMGAIMCIGVATANSILVITFANDRRQEGDNAIEAAYLAGRTRLRPVLMTALAMIMGMLPMALGLGEGGEQNAPLGRAVIGGLFVATVTTLFLVPVVYSVCRRRQPARVLTDADLDLPESAVPSPAS